MSTNAGEGAHPAVAADGFDGVVFAGGGCRCFWQAGFWTVAAEPLAIAPRAVAAVSAGVAFACAAMGGNLEEVVRDFRRRTAANRRNVYLGNALRRRPMFPHGEIYRDTILAMVDADTLARIRQGPQIRALIAYPPPRFAPAPAAVLAFAAYRLDRAVRGSVHPTYGRALGFREQVVPVGDCTTPQQLADLILQSSCMPPITPQYTRDGAPVVDGGILDGAPADLVSDCRRTLVLLTRQYGQLPQSERRQYVQPSEPIPVSMWDYTSPSLVQQTFDLGRRDGERFVAARRH
ncbi:MAG: patatin-like phospholipase family protein [Deltaproteobacteria bacterium]|nr:patatin-like phospholipase family protein [Deltaproteobacteria bacterium]